MSQNPRAVVTGSVWMGSGIGSIESALTEIFQGANDEVMLTVYTIGSHADLVFDLLRASLCRGILVKLAINQLGNQPPDVIDALLSLAREFSHFQLFDFSDNNGGSLHAKAVVADHKIALVGSSNMSKRGLFSNHELAVLLSGDAAIGAGKAMDLLLNSKALRRVR